MSVSAASMRSGAREANEESARMAQARDLGSAVGSLAAFVATIQKLDQRVAHLEREVDELRATNTTGAEK